MAERKFGAEDLNRNTELGLVSVPRLVTELEDAGAQELVSIAEELQNLVLGSVDVGDFLFELAEYSSTLASAHGEQLECTITLFRRRRALTGGGSSERARVLNEIQERMGEGPCLTALTEVQTVVVDDVATDHRWPRYAQELLKEGVRGVLAVPLVLEHGAAGSVNFFSVVPGRFTAELVAAAEEYASHAQRALRLAVRIGAKQQLAEDLERALKSRTAIDLAVGVIMGQQRCSQTTAFEVLRTAASTRNQKLRDVAEELLAKLTASSVETHFDQ